MATHNAGLQSIFSQKLDRAVFATYFLGSVVPLAALAAIVHRMSAGGSEGGGMATAEMIGVVCGASVLSLAAFLALRRITGRAIQRMDSDNARLQQLLGASKILSDGAHSEDAAQTTATCALALTRANAAFVLVSGGANKPLMLTSKAGAKSNEIYADWREQIEELVDTACRSGRTEQLNAGAGDGTRPAAIVAVGLNADSATGALVVMRVGREEPFVDNEMEALDTLAAFTSVALSNADLHMMQRNFFAHVTDMLVNALDAHVDRRSGHAQHVAQLANRIGRELDLGEEQLQQLHFAALLHDIGMLKVDPDHQRSPKHFRKHPGIGARMLSRIRLWEELAPLVQHHHEHFDGSGYPDGLAGEAIPLQSRIILVADAFDAMTRDDTHRSAMPLSDALQELRDGSGTQFDPRVVTAFEALAQRGEVTLRG